MLTNFIAQRGILLEETMPLVGEAGDAVANALEFFARRRGPGRCPRRGPMDSFVSNRLVPQYPDRTESV